MLRSALRFMLATLMLAGYVPLPVGVAGGAAGPAAGSCCAPKACCMAAHGAAHGCSAGGACERGASESAAGGPVLVAGGCGMPTPRVTPVSPDPTLAPRADLAAAPWAGLASRVQVHELIFSGVAPDPSVPPPRA